MFFAFSPITGWHTFDQYFTKIYMPSSVSTEFVFKYISLILCFIIIIFCIEKIMNYVAIKSEKLKIKDRISQWGSLKSIQVNGVSGVSESQMIA